MQDDFAFLPRNLVSNLILAGSVRGFSLRTWAAAALTWAEGERTDQRLSIPEQTLSEPK
jgi:hypothetical protein